MDFLKETENSSLILSFDLYAFRKQFRYRKKYQKVIKTFEKLETKENKLNVF